MFIGRVPCADAEIAPAHGRGTALVEPVFWLKLVAFVVSAREFSLCPPPPQLLPLFLLLTSVFTLERSLPAFYTTPLTLLCVN